MTYLFVYGTLKQGYGNNRLLRESESVCCNDDFITPPEFDMLDIGNLPGLILGPYCIKGELWKIDDLEPFDWLEGHPSFYHREEFSMGSYEPVWTYLIGNDWFGCPNQSERIVQTENVKEWQ